MAHTYWRLRIPLVGGGSGYYACAVGVEMRESIGGPNVVTGGTPIAGSVSDAVTTPIAAAFQPWSSDVGGSGTYWSSAQNASPVNVWVGYQFAAPVEIEEITLTGVREAIRMPMFLHLEYSDDGVAWTVKYSWAPAQPWAIGGVDNRVFNNTNTTVETDPIVVQNGRMMAAIRIPSPQLSATMFRGMVTIGYPAARVDATHGQALYAVNQDAIRLDVTHGQAMMAGMGRISNPLLRDFTFSIDGHDYYAIRLGDDATLVYDLFSEQWMEWSSTDLPFWRANVGINWLGAIGLANEYGSDVVIGDDTFGLLWFLDPEQGFDQHPDYLNYNQTLLFERIVMGQAPIKGREVAPCNVIYLDGDNYGLTGTSITLYTSDDQGRTFDTQDTINVIPGDLNQEIAWRSLGQITNPGRLFKIVDDGVFARIDGMTMNDEDQ